MPAFDIHDFSMSITGMHSDINAKSGSRGSIVAKYKHKIYILIGYNIATILNNLHPLVNGANFFRHIYIISLNILFYCCYI